MTLRSASLLAFVGSLLITVFLLGTFLSAFINVLRDVAAPVILVPLFIYAFGCFCVTVFFYVFHRGQS
jgi:hypothetical protein